MNAAVAMPDSISLVGKDLRDVVNQAIDKLVARGLLALAFTTTARSAMVTVIETAMDAGAGAALIRIYNGTRPASGGSATTLLAELTCSDPAGTVTNGVLTFSAITQDSSADATGTATWFRVVDSNAAWVIDGNVGTSGSDMNLTTTSITATQPVSITSATITAPNA